MKVETLNKINKIVINSELFKKDRHIAEEELYEVLKNSPKLCKYISELFDSEIITPEILEELNNSNTSDYTKKLVLIYLQMNDYVIVEEEEIEEEDFDSFQEVNEDYDGEDILTRYLYEIRKYNVLSVEEENRLFTEYKRTRDPKIKEYIINHNLRLVVHYARKIKCDQLSLLDSIQEGNLGLMTAVDRYEPDRGYRFSTYATWWIKQAIRRARSTKDNAIRIPVHQYDKNKKIQRYIDQFVQENGKNPSYEELSEISGFTIGEIKAFYLYKSECISYNIPKGEDQSEDFTLLDLLSIEPDMTEELFQEELKEKLNILFEELDSETQDKHSRTSKYADVLKKRYGIGIEKPMTLDQIAKEYHVTRERIRQIEVRALRFMRQKKRKLDGFND